MNPESGFDSLQRSSLSLVDDVGVVFFDDRKIYRAISEASCPQVRVLFECGLVERLVTAGLIPPTAISKKSIAEWPMVVEHERIQPVLYPYEWSPEMLRSAALCVLAVNEVANEYGYELKDAHPYNVVFDRSRPLYVDFGSIVQRASNAAWRAEEEFVDRYYYMLKLVERGFDSIYKHAFLLCGTGLSGIDLAMVTNRGYHLLGRGVTRKVLKAISIYKNGPLTPESVIRARIPNPLLAGFATFFLRTRGLPFRRLKYASLRKKILSLNLTRKSMWSGYHHEAGFYDEAGEIKLTPRMEWVARTAERLSPVSILELAGNQGILSRSLAKVKGVRQVVCTDYDPHAIDQLLLRSKPGDNVFMGCFDFMVDARESLTRERAARLRSDLVIALAVTHHLTLSQQFSLYSVLKTISSYTRKHVIVEFMPLGLWDGKSAPPIPSWYNEEWFAREFEKFFTVLERVQLEENRIAYLGAVLPASEPR